MLAIAVLLAYVPAREFFLERFLTDKARILSGSTKATVHCNTLFGTWIDPNSLAAGYPNPETGQIVFHAPWCGVLMDHFGYPERMDTKGIFSMQIFAHEAMHVRGELNEVVTVGTGSESTFCTIGVHPDPCFLLGRNHSGHHLLVPASN